MVVLEQSMNVHQAHMRLVRPSLKGFNVYTGLPWWLNWKSNCLESRRLWDRIPHEQPFFYGIRKQSSQVLLFAYTYAEYVAMLTACALRTFA